MIANTCHSYGVASTGSLTENEVMLVVDSPTRTEQSEGQLYIGESGRLLEAILTATGWDRERTYCTSLLCFHTSSLSHSPYYGETVSACYEMFRTRLEICKPKLLVVVGKEAVEHFFKGQTIGQVQGGVFWQENVFGSSHSCYVLPTYSPNAILWGSSQYIYPIFRDFSKIKKVVQWECGAPLAHITYSVAESNTDAQEWLDALPSNSLVAVDIETASGKDADGIVDVFNDRLLCVGLSDGIRTMVIPAEHAQQLDWNIYIHRWLYHHGNFDAQGIFKFLGLKLPINDDTMLMSYALDERTGVHGLKGLAREYLGAGFYEEEAHSYAKAAKGFEFIPKEILYPYNARDVCYTARLAPILIEMMEADNVMQPYRELLIPAANVFADIQYRGIQVDIDRLNDLCLKWYPLWQQTIRDLQAHGEAIGAPAPFNINSNAQLKHLVYDVLGLKQKTRKVSKKTGELSLDKDVLEELEGSHPFIDELIEFRKLDKIVTYTLTVRNFIKLDGRLHATTRLHGTVTGRTSYVDPPMQTIPNPKYEKNKKYKEFRDIVVPHNSATHIIAEADLSRAEMWAAVTYSHDPNMLADLQTGDPHTQTAMTALGKLREEVTKQDRTDMKHVTFGKMYGRGDAALQKGELRRWTLAQVRAFSKRWDDRYSVYIGWNNEQRRIAETEGELVSITGRKRRFHLILPEDYKLLNEAVNFPVQNLASDTILKAMIELHDALAPYDSYILVMIHDSLVFELAKEHLHITIPLIKAIMEKPMFPGAYGIPIEMAIGPNWGNTNEIDLEAEIYANATAS